MALKFKQIVSALVLFYLAGTMLCYHHPHRNRHPSQKLSKRQKPPASLGAAKMFSPVPRETVIGQCEWEMVKDIKENRIPRTITNVFCLQPEAICSGRRSYRCGNVRSTMPVAYTENGDIVYERNMTISVGCACIRRTSNRVSIWNKPYMRE